MKKILVVLAALPLCLVAGCQSDSVSSEVASVLNEPLGAGGAEFVETQESKDGMLEYTFSPIPDATELAWMSSYLRKLSTESVVSSNAGTPRLGCFTKDPSDGTAAMDMSRFDVLTDPVPSDVNENECFLEFTVESKEGHTFLVKSGETVGVSKILFTITPQ